MKATNLRAAAGKPAVSPAGQVLVLPPATSVAKVLVMAKAPIPGEVKTRLCPPLSPAGAATLAAAALLDTMDAVEASRPDNFGHVHGVLALSGRLTAAPDGSAIAARLRRRYGSARHWLQIEQFGDDFAERLIHAHADAHDSDTAASVLQIGMDTPQVTPALLARCLDQLQIPGVDAVLGPAGDGGWWGLGVRHPESVQVLRTVAMSTARTGRDTLHALRRIGLNVAILPTLTDVDTITDAERVARLVPSSRFAVALRSLLVDAA